MTDIDVGTALTKWRAWRSRSVEELAAIGTAFVWSLGLEPMPETTASSRLTRRTIRYYISSRLMDPPEGERRLAEYRYRHLLQLLYIKARQHAGDRLDDIRSDLSNLDAEKLEAALVEALPESVPGPVPDDPGEFRPPAQLDAVIRRWAYLTGREGRWREPPMDEGFILERRASPSLASQVSAAETTRAGNTSDEPTMRQRVEIELGDDVRLSVPADHPLVVDEEGRGLVIRRLRRALRGYQ